MSLNFADTGTEIFTTDEDAIELKKEPPGSLYDERMSMLGSMKMQVGDLDKAGASDIFSDDRMVEVKVDKRALAEFQLKAIVVSLTLGGRTYTNIGDIVGKYRKLNLASKEWIDDKVDSVWKRHEEEVKATTEDKDLGKSS